MTRPVIPAPGGALPALPAPPPGRREKRPGGIALTVLLYIVLGLAALTLAASYALFRVAFARGRSNDFTKMTLKPDSPFFTNRELLDRGLAFVRAQSFEEVDVTSFDGLRLRGRYYPAEEPRAVALLFHGWRSVAQNDFCCALEFLRSRRLGVLLADQRAHGESQGRVMTFGVWESRDVRTWADWAAERFPSRPIILEGISMGAATVMMAAAAPLPETVRGIVADCGYTSPRDIFCSVAARCHVPPAAAWPLIRLGARLFGGFDPAEGSAQEAMAHCALPCLFIHGEADDFVPCQMSRRNYAACAAPWKKLITVPGAQHGFAYVVAPGAVESALDEFLSAAL